MADHHRVVLAALQETNRLRENFAREVFALETQLTRIVLVDDKRDAVKRAYDVEYDLTGDTRITSRLLEALGLDETKFLDEEANGTESKD